MRIGKIAPERADGEHERPAGAEPDDQQRDQRHLRQRIERGDEHVGDGAHPRRGRDPDAEQRADDERDAQSRRRCGRASPSRSAVSPPVRNMVDQRDHDLARPRQIERRDAGDDRCRPPRPPARARPSPSRARAGRRARTFAAGRTALRRRGAVRLAAGRSSLASAGHGPHDFVAQQAVDAVEQRPYSGIMSGGHGCAAAADRRRSRRRCGPAAPTSPGSCPPSRIASSIECVTRIAVVPLCSTSRASCSCKHQPRLRIERAERLVEQQHVRIHHQRAREPDALAHAAGELARILVLETGEIDCGDRLARARLALAPSARRQASSRRRRSRAP